MLLEVDVYWFPDGVDPEQEENLGKKIKLDIALIVINTEHIAAFHKNDNGHAMIRLSTGDVFETTTKYSAFREIMEGEQLAKNMLVSGEN